jgi:beta-galactosidase
MLVMDENRTFNPSPWAVEQLQAMIKRDRNHPSIILWSIFNEELLQDTEQGKEIARRRLAAEIRRLDNTRPITAAMNGGCSDKDGVPQVLDVVGANYPNCQDADQFHRTFPDKTIIGSEDTSSLAVRGAYETDPSRQLVSSYDTEKVPWGMLNRDILRYYAERPWLAGGFSWTGFDYRGETAPYNWPQVNCDYGILDLCGFPKTAFFIRQSQWVKHRSILVIAPHWNWPGREGKPVKVVIISNAKRVSLSHNGYSLGEKEVPAFDYAVWEVPYAPGKLEAVASTDGREVARTAVETTDPAATLRLLPDRRLLLGDGRDAMPITVEAIDSQGRPVPDANAKVTFAVEGPGENIGHGNGDPNCHDPEKGPDRRLFNGLAQLIVRSIKGQHGDLVIRAASPGLTSATVTITVSPAPNIPAIASVLPDCPLIHWRMSPASTIKPDTSAQIDESDMNTWTMPSVGRTQQIPASSWALYRATFTPWKAIARQGGSVRLRKVSGTGEVWLDGKCVHTKTDPAPGDLRFDLPSGNGLRTLVLLLQAGSDGKIGLGGSAGISVPDAVRNSHD